jgi:hypothetical protein
MKPRDGLAVIGKSVVNSFTSTEVPTSGQRTILCDELVWNGITVLVSYEPHWLGLPGEPLSEFDFAHLELKVLEPVGAPLPVTDTGYWSEFLSVGEAEDEGGPKAIAAALLDEMSNTKSWRVAWARWEQRDLFA